MAWPGHVIVVCWLVSLLGALPTPAAAAAIRPVERTIELNGLTTRVVEVGDPAAGETAILVNGGPGQSSDHLAGLFALAGPDLRVVAYDQRGNGGTARPADGDYSTPALIADLDALITELGGEPVHLVGNSWGGFLAAVYTGSHPERVASLSLIGPMPLAPSSRAVTVWGYGDAAVSARVYALQREGTIPNPLPAWTEDEDCTQWNAILPAYMGDPTGTEPGRATLAEGTCSAEVFERTYGGAMAFAYSDAYRDEIIPAAAAWPGPVYVVFGANDPFREAYSAPGAAAFSGADLVVETIPAAGHYPWVEDPTLIDRLRAFMLGADSAATPVA